MTHSSYGVARKGSQLGFSRFDSRHHLRALWSPLFSSRFFAPLGQCLPRMHHLHQHQVCVSLSVCVRVKAQHLYQKTHVILRMLASSIALYGLLLFYGLTSDELKGRRPMAKFLAIKLIVMFTFYQSFVVRGSQCRFIPP